MKYNYTLNENNIIIEYHSVPFDSSKPFIEAEESIAVGIDKVVNGKFIKDSETIEKLARIAELKKLLADSDYKQAKFIDGALTAEEYAPIKTQRQAWRDEINELQK